LNVLYFNVGKAKEEVVEDVSNYETPTTEIVPLFESYKIRLFFNNFS